MAEARSNRFDCIIIHARLHTTVKNCVSIRGLKDRGRIEIQPRIYSISYEKPVAELAAFAGQKNVCRQPYR